MKFNKILDTILGQASKLTLLRFMVLTDAEMNGRELAKAVGLSHVKCHKALKELNEHGLITIRKIGTSLIYQIEKDHILYADFLKPLFEREMNLLKSLGAKIVDELKGNTPISIAIFGSIAEKKEKPNSDIDLLIVTNSKKSSQNTRKMVDSIEGDLTLRFGNQLSPIIITVHEFSTMIQKKEPLYMNILKNYKIIYGKDLREVLS